MQEIDIMRNMIFVYMFLWMVYPYLVTRLRPKTFKGYEGLFIYYCLIIGLCNTIGTNVILSLFGGIVTFEITLIGLLLGFISETIILFPDVLEKQFKFDIKSGESMMKFVKIYLYSFIAIMVVLKFFVL